MMSGFKGHNYEHGKGDICKKCGKIHVHHLLGKKLEQSGYKGHNHGLCRKCGKFHRSGFTKGNKRTEEWKKKMTTFTFKGRKHSLESRQKMSKKIRAYINRLKEEGIPHHAKGFRHTDETKRKLSDYFKKHWKKHSYPLEDSWMYNTEKRKVVCKKISEKLKGKSVSLEQRKKISETIKKLHKSGRYDHIFTDEFKLKRFQALCRRPTKPERSVIKLLKKLNYNDFRYIGNGTKIVNGKFPDFINEKRNKIIEVFGSRWHEPEEVKERINIFAEVGFGTLILWDYEIKNENKATNKLVSFVEGGDVP